MDPDIRYTYVGASMLALVAALVAALLWLNRGKQDSASGYFTIYFKDNAVNGLQQDSAVTMLGIKVGIVKSLEISSSNGQRVKVTINLRESTPVKVDTVAVIQRNLLTGLASIDLLGGSPSSPALEIVRDNEEHPIIREGETGLQTLQKSLPEMMDRANQMVDRAMLVFSEDNLSAMSAVIKNVEVISTRVANQDDELNQTLKEVSLLVQDLQRLVKNLDNRSDALTRSLTQGTNAFSREMDALTQDMRRAARTLTSTLEAFQNPRSIITGPDERMLGPGERRK